MIKLYEDEKDCCGCSACASICPKNAITMVENERGFLMPQINTESCIECGLCLKACDFKVFKPTENKPAAYAFRYLKPNALNTSQSGGAAAAFTDTILEKGGVIFGAEIVNNFEIAHRMESTREGCEAFKGSKYVQSNMNTCFSQCQQGLREGKTVLFVGMGCQIHGLLRFLEATKTPMDKLYTVDIVCHGVPSTGIWKKYIEMFQKKLGAELVSIRIRDKEKYGWRSIKEKYNTSDGRELYIEKWNTLYFNRIVMRDSCFNCKYTTTNRKSDITVGDFWGIENVLPALNDNKGVSVVLVHTEKGRQLLQELSGQVEIKEVALENALQPQLQNPTKKGLMYSYFWKRYSANAVKTLNCFLFPNRWDKLNFFLVKVIEKLKSKL